MMGMRNTKQKQCIQRILKNAKGPLSIQEILAEGQLTLPGLGIATVYRAIGALQEQGDVAEVSLPNGDHRYEFMHLGHHHHHFLCRKCERAFDLHKCPVSTGLGRFAPKGFHVESHELTLHGICGNCAKQ